MARTPPHFESPMRALLVAGMSGAGKTTVLNALEDQGWRSVDNPPIGAFGALIESLRCERTKRIAIGLDMRSLQHSLSEAVNAIAALKARMDVHTHVLFLDCDDARLLRRFSETRRRHPLADGAPVEVGLAMERALLSPIREQADGSLDTTEMSAADLRREVTARYADVNETGMTLSIMSFGFKHGAPREADMVFDARFLANPYWAPELRNKSGLEPDVAAYIAADPSFEPFFDRILSLVSFVLPLQERERRSYVGVAIGCTGGRHRSVALAEKLGAALRAAGLRPNVRHRDIHLSSHSPALPPATDKGDAAA